MIATVISDGNCSWIRGGICQFLVPYIIAFSANLEVIERHSHSLPRPMCLGKDATIVYGILDFGFRNNTEGYILIDYKIEG